MPTPKRWFPKSRDFNDDPEGWELTDKFGDRTVRLWDEICAILDKTDNHWRVSGQWLASLSRKVRQSSATCSRAIGWMVAKQWLTIDKVSADGSPLVYSSPNYWKFHKKKESKRESHGTAAGAGDCPSLPYPNLPYPNLPSKDPEPASPGPVDKSTKGHSDRAMLEVAAAIVKSPGVRFDTPKFSAMAKRICGNDGSQLDRMVRQILSWSDGMKGEPVERKNAVVEATLLAVENGYVKQGKPINTLWGLMDTIYNTERTKYIQGPEHEANKQIPVPEELKSLMAGIGNA